MRTLTICQPYAELIMRGEKRVENRTWPKCDLYVRDAYNGSLLIHAGKSRKWLGTYDPLPDHMDFGAIIGMVDVVGIVRLTSAMAPPWLGKYEHAEGPICWILERPQRFETPIPYRGQQRIWHVPDELLPAGITR